MARADFVFQRKLGQGSFGEVFEVTRIADGLRYVIKTMAAQGSSRKEQQDALNEVRLLAGLDHPRVVRYHDSFCEQGQLHIVMELCDGGDLSQLIERQEGVLLAEDDVWQHFAQTLLGLHHLHGAKILHRDLKTRNLFLGEGGVKIGDLGVARLLGASTEFASTMVGTPYYLSPELCENAPYNEKARHVAHGIVPSVARGIVPSVARGIVPSVAHAALHHHSCHAHSAPRRPTCGRSASCSTSCSRSATPSRRATRRRSCSRL